MSLTGYADSTVQVLVTTYRDSYQGGGGGGIYSGSISTA